MTQDFQCFSQILQRLPAVKISCFRLSDLLRLCDVEEGRSWEDLGHPRQVPVVLNRPVNDHDEALLRAVTEGLDQKNPDGIENPQV